MATIIDALVVTLGLDPKGIKAGASAADAALGKTEAAAKKTAKTVADVEKAKKAESKATVDASRAASAAETKSAKESEARGKTVAMAFSKIRNEALALVGVFTAGMGIKNFAESTITGAASLGLMATNLNMSTEKLSAWQRAAERAGGTAEGMTAQLQESASESAKAKMGQGTSTAAMFYSMNGDPAALKDGNSFLLARSAIVAKLYETDKARAQLVASQMGISEQQFNLIKQGPAAILALVAAQEKNSNITDKQAAEALKLQNRWLDLRDRLKVVGTTILLELMPTFERLFTVFQSWADELANNKEGIKKWVDDTVEKISEFIKAIDGVAESIGGWKVVLGGLLALKVLSAVTPLIALAGALTSIGSALGAIGLAGPAALVAIAGVAGWGVGKGINHLLSDDVKNAIGEFAARTAASLGSREAGEAIRINTGKDDYNTGPKGVSANSADVVKKLIGMGWTPAQAAGIAGSLQQESGLDPAARNKTSGAYGIGQWLGSRVQDFKNFSGKDLVGSSLDDQLKFQQYEMTKGKEKSAGDKLRASKTASDAARIHSEAYERPGAAEDNIAQRQANAEAFLQQQAMSSANIPTGARAAAPVRGGSTSTSSNETNINGPITIQTAATDADAIAKDFAASVRKHSFVSQANSGLN